MFTDALTTKELKWVMRQTRDPHLVDVVATPERMPVKREQVRQDDAMFWLVALASSSGDALIGKDLDGVVTSWNKAAELMFGYTAGEIIGLPIDLLVPPDSVGEANSTLERIWKGDGINYLQTGRRSKDGEIIPVSITDTPIHDGQGKIIGGSEIVRVRQLRADHKSAEGRLTFKSEAAERAILAALGSSNYVGHECGTSLAGSSDVLLQEDRNDGNRSKGLRVEWAGDPPEWANSTMGRAYWFAMQEICDHGNITETEFLLFSEGQHPDLPPAAALQLEILHYLRRQSGVLQALDKIAVSQPDISRIAAVVAPVPVALHVLVVDDVAMNRDLAACFLRAAGHQVTCVEGGAEAIVAVSNADFSVVLMDVRMPEMDGLEATRRIRALGGQRGHVPIVALTARAFTEQVAECRAAGMDGHLPKPFGPDKLLAAVLRAAAAGPSYGANLITEQEPGDDRVVPAVPVIDAEPPVLDRMAFDSTAHYLPVETVSAYLRAIADYGEALLDKLRDQNVLIRCPAEVCEAACTIAGSAGMFGFAGLASLGQRLERAIQFGTSDAPALADALKTALEAALQVIYDGELTTVVA